MIQKLSSQDLNDILENAESKIPEINTKIDTIKSDIQQKLTIIRYETDYVNDYLNNLKSGMYTTDGNLKALINVSSTMHEAYGAVAHAQFLKEPTNVFNLKVGSSGEVFFRTDIKAAVNGNYDNAYKDIMKHDSLSKNIFFQELTSPNITIALTLEDTLLGSTQFNMIEIDSFLNGSYDITELRIYKLNDDGTENETCDTYSYPAAGKLRMLLPEKVSFYKVEIDFTINYETYKNGTKIYPFGLKHIYLYDADFRPESYAVVEISSDKNIAYINEDMSIKEPTGIRDTTMTSEGIIVYVDYSNGVFETPVPTSTANQLNLIARDVKTLYAKIPLYNKAIIGVSFDFTTK